LGGAAANTGATDKTAKAKKKKTIRRMRGGGELQSSLSIRRIAMNFEYKQKSNAEE
jgi:hypothetical protein